MKKLVVSTGIALMLGACAFTPQEAVLAPNVNVSEANIGNGMELSLRVVDERTQKIIGHRGAGGNGAKITTNQDFTGLFYKLVSEALKAKNFTTVLYSAQRKLQLRIDVLKVEYDVSTGFFTGGVHVSAAIKATASDGDKAYDKVYIAEDEKRVVFIPGGGENEKQINKAISDVIEKMVADQQLMSFLANAEHQRETMGSPEQKKVLVDPEGSQK